MRALFVTDRSLAEGVRPALAAEGVRVDVAERVRPVDFPVRASRYGAVLVERGRLEGGYSGLLRWRLDGLKAHVLVLLPGDSDSHDRAKALDAGADAYLLQPLCAEELRAVLRAFRRRDEQAFCPVRRAHDLEIDTSRRTVQRGGRPIRLTPREFTLLELLARHQGRVVSRAMIREQIYGRDREGSNVIDVYVRYLRKKIDEGFDPPLILTHWGAGYLLRGEDG
jgi:DNA-binding response OmpR family regulator